MQWSKKLDEVANKKPLSLYYKGLVFPPYCGILSAEQERSGRRYFAYYGSEALTENQVMDRIDGLIAAGQLAAA